MFSRCQPHQIDLQLLHCKTFSAYGTDLNWDSSTLCVQQFLSKSILSATKKGCWRAQETVPNWRTVRNDLDCFKLSKWSDESPLMARPLRLLFYLGQLLSIHLAFPMHKLHNTLQFFCDSILYSVHKTLTAPHSIMLKNTLLQILTTSSLLHSVSCCTTPWDEPQKAVSRSL